MGTVRHRGNPLNMPPLPDGVQQDPQLRPPQPFNGALGDGYVETVQRVGELVMEEVPEDELVEDLAADEPTLTDEERALFSSLLQIGKRSKTITVMGHDITIQTLNNADDIRVGMACREYSGVQLAEQRAFHVAVCAAGIQSVDGVPFYQSLNTQDSDQEVFDAKRSKVLGMWPIATTRIYREIMDLDAEFAALVEKLGKSLG